METRQSKVSCNRAKGDNEPFDHGGLSASQNPSDLPSPKQDLETDELDQLVWVALELQAEKLDSPTQLAKSDDRNRLSPGERFPDPALERLNIRRALCGDQNAKTALVRQHEPLVASMARKYSRGSLRSDDLESDANITILDSIGDFDLSRGVRFVSFLQWRLVEAMQAAVAESGSALKIPRRVLSQYKRDAASSNTLVDDGEDNNSDYFIDPTDSELTPVEIVRFSESENPEITGRQYSPAQTVGLDSILDLEDESIALDEQMQNSQLISVLGRIWTQLDAREQQILALHFGLDGSDEQSLTDISKGLGITRQRAGQVMKAALGKLQAALQDDIREFE